MEVLKGVFGLSTSPKLWWTKLSGDLKKLEVTIPGLDYKLRIEQNPIDSCVFLIVDPHLKVDKRVCGLLLTHVDDLLLLTEPFKLPFTLT